MVTKSGNSTRRNCDSLRVCFVGALANIHMRRWVEFFAKAGHDVHVISTVPMNHPVPHNIRVYFLPVYRTGSAIKDFFLGGLSGLLRVVQLRRLFRKIHPDIVHVHYVTDVALFALLTGFRPLIVTAWGSDILIAPKKSWIRKCAVGFTLRRADLVTCDADHMKQRIAAFGVDAERIHVIFFGTNVENFNPCRQDELTKSELAPRTGPIVISIRNLEPIYDIATLIRAVPLVCAVCPEVTFLVGGSGSQSEELRSLAMELGVQDRIHFLGTLSQDQLPMYLASADVYVSTALSDGGIAASTAEAMASAVPVIITDVGDNRQWVKNGVSGFLIQPRDWRSLAEQIIELLTRKTLKKDMGMAGRQIIMKSNNLYVEMTKMERVYQDQCAKGDHHAVDRSRPC